MENKLKVILKKIDRVMGGYKITIENKVIKLKDWVCTDLIKFYEVSGAIKSISWDYNEVLEFYTYNEEERCIELHLTDEAWEIVKEHREKENE